MTIALSLLTVLSFASLPSAAVLPLTPGGGDCHAELDELCAALRGEEALRCSNEADAQCDIADADRFIAAGDHEDAVNRVEQACTKYEDQLRMMLVDAESSPLAAVAVRYAGVTASVFALLAREGEVEDLGIAVDRLERSREFLADLRLRREDLVVHPDLSAAVDDMTRRLAAALDQLSHGELQRAETRFREAGEPGRGDGGAQDYFRRAVEHSVAAYALVPNFAYKLQELDGELAQADLHAVLARDDRNEAARACAGYRSLVHELADIARSAPQTWKGYPALHDFDARARRGVRACTARPRIIVGGVAVGIGAAALGASLGLYAQYASACRYDAVQAECAGITSAGDGPARYDAQVRASYGLAAVGATALVSGAAIMIHGLVQKSRARPRRFALSPALSWRQVGAVFEVRF